MGEGSFIGRQSILIGIPNNSVRSNFIKDVYRNKVVLATFYSHISSMTDRSRGLNYVGSGPYRYGRYSPDLQIP